MKQILELQQMDTGNILWSILLKKTHHGKRKRKFGTMEIDNMGAYYKQFVKVK
jgi:adenylate kinase family enzyme